MQMDMVQTQPSNPPVPRSGELLGRHDDTQNGRHRLDHPVPRHGRRGHDPAASWTLALSPGAWFTSCPVHGRLTGSGCDVRESGTVSRPAFYLSEAKSLRVGVRKRHLKRGADQNSRRNRRHTIRRLGITLAKMLMSRKTGSAEMTNDSARRYYPTLQYYIYKHPSFGSPSH